MAPSPTPPTSSSHGKHGLLIWGGIALACLAVLVGTYFLFVQAPPPKRIVIATGTKSGAYYQLAQKYAEPLRKEGVTLEVRETKGSVENIGLLEDDASGVSFAIIQSGVARPEDGARLQALGSLYREPLWVFYRGDKPIDRLSQLAGKRIGVGPEGSGTLAVAAQLLDANGIVESAGDKTVLVKDNVADAAQALQKADLDAAFFVAAFQADYIQRLLKDENVHLMSFAQQDAYDRLYRFLAPVTVPAGLVNLGQNLPSKDVALVAPTAMLIARKDVHPALIPLLLTIAASIHEQGDELSKPGEFPSASYTDVPIGEHAELYYKSGPPLLQRVLPFWLASLVDRLKVMLVPLIMLLLPMLRAAPPLVRWRTRRKVYRWYAALREVDKRTAGGLTASQLDEELARVGDIDRQVNDVHVPLGYMHEFYHLRLHLKMLQEQLEKLKVAPAKGA
jgi:TRAP transporter TAXI family solute receptor